MNQKDRRYRLLKLITELTELISISYGTPEYKTLNEARMKLYETLDEQANESS